MPRYAAVDIGSNSLRFQVAEMSAGRPMQVLAAERLVTRLGESVFRTGAVSAEAMSMICGELAKAAEVKRRFDVLASRAVATAAIRDASNQHVFLERASEAFGEPVEVISGQEEARLIHLGVEARWPHPNRRILIIDLGGGSSEVILAENGRMLEAVSKPIGAVRLTGAFLKNDPPTPLELHQLDEFIHEKIDAIAARIQPGKVDRVIATSASAAAIVCAINRVDRAHRETADRLRATTAQVRKFYREISAMDLAARRKVNGIGPRRAEIIIAGAAVYLRLLERFQLSSMYYTLAGLRDGIIADLFARGAGRDLTRLSREQRRACEQLAKKYAVPMAHARKVAQLAQSLFEQLQPVHQLPPWLGKMVEAAALLHDVGHYVSDTAHHKHSHYLVANSDLPGFTDQERAIIAALCRYHRKSMPKPGHDTLSPLDEEMRRAVLLLIPILRLADGLDRGHNQDVDGVVCDTRNSRIVIALQSNRDTDLEQWAAERAAPLFREVYNREMAVVRGRG